MNGEFYVILLFISATINFILAAAIVFTAYYTSKLVNISENVKYIADCLYEMQFDKDQHQKKYK